MSLELQDKHIFIVEDNAANAGIMMTTLQMAGAFTRFDRWGRDTIIRIKSDKHVDLILMDLMLPNGLTGYDVYDELQKEPELSDIPVVIVSASDANIEMNKARQKGFAGYICKPISFATFPRIIAAILKGEEFWGEDFVYLGENDIE